MADWDTTALLAEIRSRALAPSSSSSAPGWQDSDLLRMANAEMATISERLRRMRSGYFNVQTDTPFVAAQASYRLPTRSMHGIVGLVQRLGSDGVLHRSEKWTEGDLAGLNPATAGTPEAHIFRNNSVALYPVPDSASESLRITYPRRPNKLVAVASAGVSTSKTATTVVFGVTVASLGFTTTTPLDFIRANPPFDSLADDKTPTIASASTLTFASGVIPSDFAIGDYVCLAGQAPVAQLPTEAFYVLAQRVANELVKADAAMLQSGLAVLQALEGDLYGGASDRDDEEPDHVSNEVWG